MRKIIILVCTKCKHHNYTTTKKKDISTEKKLELRKYCKFCRVHTLHKEIKA
jgi:large subunit ribosomal protein L33